MPYLIGILGTAALLAGLVAILNRPQRIRIDAEIPSDFPADGFSHAGFEALLRQYVRTGGGVDYEGWRTSKSALAQLESYLAAVARFSPVNTPERFPDKSDRLAYWLYAYNAYVIRSVIRNWPIDSVTDLKAPFEVVKGLGFFHRLRFSFGGEYHSLLAVENRIIRKRFRDPRIHFVLNCGSASCPAMHRSLPVGEELESFLQSSAREFVRHPDNLSFDHAKRQIVVSAIFKWFRKDFLNDLARRGLPSQRGIVDYIASVAPEPLRNDLDQARGYALVYRDFDWSLNRVEDGPE